MEIKDFQTLIKSSISLVSDLLDLLATEAKLAGKSAIALCSLMVFMVILLASTWLCVLGAIFALLFFMGLNSISIFLILAAFNIVLMMIILCLAKSYQKNLEFSATRRQLANKPEVSS